MDEKKGKNTGKNENKKNRTQSQFLKKLMKWYKRYFASRSSSDIHIDLGSRRK